MRNVKAIKLKIKPKSFSKALENYTDIARCYSINLDQTTSSALSIRKTVISFSKKFNYEKTFTLTGDIKVLYNNLFFKTYDNAFYYPSIVILKSNPYFIKTIFKYEK